MPSDRTTRSWLEIAFAILLLMPVAVLFFAAAESGMRGWMWFTLILLLCVWMLWIFARGPGARGRRDEGERERAEGPRMLHADEQPEMVREIMDVRVAMLDRGIRVLRGPLRVPSAAAYEALKRESPKDIVPLLQEDGELGAAVVLLPRPVEERGRERPSRPWVHWLLFFLAAVTTTAAGARYQGVDVFEEPGKLYVGLPYALGLLLILGVHELGHYFTARRHGMNVTPPYFIPVPFALGTFGAFIRMKSPPESRRALFDVAVAGPLAGLIVAVPALLIGLQNSTILTEFAATGEPGRVIGIQNGTSVGSSLLLAFLVKLARPEALEYGCVVQFSPLAFAGWLGVFITALNLLPIGQLDGGHTARAMFGLRTGETISNVAMWSLLLLAFFVWPGLLFWAIIVFFIAGRGSPPLDDLTPITPSRRWLGYAAFVILAVILVPLPHAFWDEVGIYCPYV